MNELSLARVLTDRRGPYEATSSEWVLLIKDHKDYIRAHSTLVDLTPEDLQRYQYMPAAYLTETARYPTSALWIFLYINDLPSVADFKPGIGPVYIPSEAVLSELYRLTCSLAAARKKSVITV